jgi:hypothetical protein
MKYLLVTCVAFVCLAVACGHRPSPVGGNTQSRVPNGLRLTIRVFQDDGDLLLNIRLENRSENAVWTRTVLTPNLPAGRLEVGNVYIDVLNDRSEPEKLHCISEGSLASVRDYAVFNPNDAVETNVILSDCYALRKATNYKVSARYRGSIQFDAVRPPNVNSFDGVLDSNVVEFRIP